jgi:rRNA maturation RNase YbeY
MIKILLNKQSNYPVKSASLKRKLRGFLEQRGIVSDAEVSVSLVGEKKMYKIGRKYLKDKKLHGVLSFGDDKMDDRFVYPPNTPIHLGEIIVCYPLAVQGAKEEKKLIEDKVYELIEHGARNLLGEHH